MKRQRIHPLVAATSIICLTVIAISAQLHGSGEVWKIVVVAFIGFLTGAKLRQYLPVT